MYATIRTVGVDRVHASETDFGQKVNPPPGRPACRPTADALFAEGLTEPEIRRMAWHKSIGAPRLSTPKFTVMMLATRMPVRPCARALITAAAPAPTHG